MAANNKRAQRVMPVTLVVGGDAYLNELNARNVREKVQKVLRMLKLLNLMRQLRISTHLTKL